MWICILAISYDARIRRVAPAGICILKPALLTYATVAVAYFVSWTILIMLTFSSCGRLPLFVAVIQSAAVRIIALGIRSAGLTLGIAQILAYSSAAALFSVNTMILGAGIAIVTCCVVFTGRCYAFPIDGIAGLTRSCISTQLIFVVVLAPS